MKIKYFLTLLLTLNFVSIYGQGAAKKDISPESPKPDLVFGRLINDPFFGLNINNDKFDETLIKQKIEESNRESSLTRLIEAVELNPDDQNLLRELGDCYLSQNKTVEALYCYNIILKKNNKDFSIYTRLQAASFQGDYIRMINSKPREKMDNLHFFQDFDYIQTAINNSASALKESLALQHYIYLLRLLLIKNDTYGINSSLTKDESKILVDAEALLKNIKTKSIKKTNISYLLGIVNYLKKDYKQALTELEKSLSRNELDVFKNEDILFIKGILAKNEKIRN